MIRNAIFAEAKARAAAARPDLAQTVRAYLDSFAAGDIDGRLRLFAPDASLEDPVGSPPVMGRRALRAFWEGASGLGVTAQLEWLAVTGDEAAYVFAARVSDAEDEVTVRTLETIRVDAQGLIVAMRAYFDVNTLS